MLLMVRHSHAADGREAFPAMSFSLGWARDILCMFWGTIWGELALFLYQNSKGSLLMQDVMKKPKENLLAKNRPLLWKIMAKYVKLKDQLL